MTRPVASSLPIHNLRITRHEHRNLRPTFALGKPPRRSPLDPERTGRILSQMGKPKGFSAWVSPYASAIDAMAEDLLHYKLDLPQKRKMLQSLFDYDHASMIRGGSVKKETRFNPLSIRDCHPTRCQGLQQTGRSRTAKR